MSGEFFLHRHAQPLHRVRQPRQGDGDAVLRQHLRGIEIGAQLERHRHCQLAVAGRLAAEIQHVLDAVDLLFQRRGDGLADHLGRGAGIGGGDLDGRRRDLGILRDRQE